MGNPNSQQWSENSSERRALDMYPGSQDTPMHGTSAYGAYTSTLDLGYVGYEASPDMGGAIPGLSTTPPTSSFAAPGLPFRGLDFIRNYNPGGYSVAYDQDSLWQSYDPGAFEYNPDLPFTLGDISSEGQDGAR